MTFPVSMKQERNKRSFSKTDIEKIDQRHNTEIQLLVSDDGF